jgi:hypothetical protein
MTKHIVTRQSFTNLITRGDATASRAVGKALVHLLNRQTDDEALTASTRHSNARGFTPMDARSGVISAKYFIKHGSLLNWQVERWIKPNVKGVPRLAKYWAQIDEEAHKKQRRVAA